MLNAILSQPLWDVNACRPSVPRLNPFVMNFDHTTPTNVCPAGSMTDIGDVDVQSDNSRAHESLGLSQPASHPAIVSRELLGLGSGAHAELAEDLRQVADGALG